MPACVGGRGAAPPQYSGGPTGYRLMLKRQQMGEKMFEPAQVETAIGVLAAAHPDRPASTSGALRRSELVALTTSRKAVAHQEARWSQLPIRGIPSG